MQIVYIGPKNNIFINLPIGTKLKTKESIKFVKNEPIEIKDDDANALIEIGGGQFIKYLSKKDVVEGTSEDKANASNAEAHEHIDESLKEVEKEKKTRGRPRKFF